MDARKVNRVPNRNGGGDGARWSVGWDCRDAEDEAAPSPQGWRSAALIVNTRSRRGAPAFAAARALLEDNGVDLGAAYALHDAARLPATVREALAEGHDPRNATTTPKIAILSEKRPHMMVEARRDRASRL